MLAYILRRIASAISVIVVTLIASFLLFFVAPTDPAGAICGNRCTPARVAEINKSLHLSDPIINQIGGYLGGLVNGRTFTSAGVTIHCSAPCLGYSYTLGQPVTRLIGQALPVTLSIVFGSAIVYLTLGTMLGTIAARHRGTPLDRATVGSSLTVGAMPYFVVALIVALYVAGPILPRAQWIPITQSPLGWFNGLLAAWLTIGATNSASYTRYSRASMIESLGEDYIRTARAKGISERRVIYRHGLRAAATPVVTIFGLDLAFAMTGAIFTETIFGLPGIGLLTLRAFFQFDLPVLMAGVLIGSTVLVLMNLIVDIFYTVLDPRVRLA